jgi:MFS superfamily sulfate permease-like transporter
MSRYSRTNGMESILIITLGLTVLVGIATAIVPSVVNTTNYVTNRHTVKGTVEAVPSSKLTLGGSNGKVTGAEKYAVRIDNKIYNCTNTQCSQLQPGDQVELSCYEEWHVFTPNEQECRFIGLL